MSTSLPSPASLNTTQVASNLMGYIPHLDQYALLEVGGRDARAFLNNQLSNDFQSITEDQARFAGLCSNKGRLLCTFLGWQAADHANPADSQDTPTHPRVWLLLSRDLLPTILQTLSKFIFRSKVTFKDVTDQFALTGLIGDNPAWIALFPTRSEAHYAVTHNDAGTLIHFSHPTLPRRSLWITPRQDLQKQTPILAKQCAALDPSLWDWLDIQAGETRITAATHELLVPQYANLDLLDGLHFKKGCYPGQEVVARLQYRGVIRRRTLLFRTTQACIGDAIFHQNLLSAPSADTTPPESCGIVINAAPHPHLANTVDCLVMLPLSTLTTGSLHIGSIDGPPLQRLPLPYALPEESEKMD